MPLFAIAAIRVILLTLAVFYLVLPAQAAEQQSHQGKHRRLAGSSYASYYIDANDILWAWGSNIDKKLPTPIMGRVIAVAAGSSHALFLRSDGSVWALGSNIGGEVGVPDAKRNVPVRILSGVEYIDAHSFQSFAIKKDGSLWGWGTGGSSMGFGPSEGIQKIPRQFLNNSLQVASGGKIILALVSSYSHMEYQVRQETDGVHEDDNYIKSGEKEYGPWLMAWGENTCGQFGNYLADDQIRPMPIRIIDSNGEEIKIHEGITQIPINRVIARIFADEIRGAVILKNGDAWLWGDVELKGCQGIWPEHTEPRKMFGGNIQDLVLTYGILVLHQDGTLRGFGSDPVVTGGKYEETPEDGLILLTDVQEIAAGNNHALALKKDGTLWTWGRNRYNQMDGTDNNYSTIIQIHLPKLTKEDIVEIVSKYE